MKKLITTVFLLIAIIAVAVGAMPQTALAAENPYLKINIISKTDYIDGGMEVDFTIRNSGSEAISLTSLYFTGADDNSSVISPDSLPMEIAAGDSVSGEAVIYFDRYYVKICAASSIAAAVMSTIRCPWPTPTMWLERKRKTIRKTRAARTPWCWTQFFYSLRRPGRERQGEPAAGIYYRHRLGQRQ
jgi:hypothetical protein